MRARILLTTTAALTLAASAALAAPAATWTYDGADALTADTAGDVSIGLTVDAPDGVRPDLPLAYRHFLVDSDGIPQEGVSIGWSRGGASGTAVVDGDGAVVLPSQPFTLADTPALTGAGDDSTLTLTLPQGDYVLFSDLVDATPPTVRRSGADRYATAAEVSRTTFAPHVGTVYVASGETFADALAAGPAAAKAGGPLLLVTHGTVPDATRSELRRLLPDQIVIVGGTAAVSEDVELELQPYAGDVTRIAGIDRYDTAARVARAMFPIGSKEAVDHAWVASGQSFADAVAAGARAAIDRVPVLLVARDSVPRATEVTISVLGISHVTVAGGSAAISPETYVQLRSIAGSATRRSGPDRYATSAALADRSGDGRTLVVATGQDFPDALTAGPLAGAMDADLLLVRPDEVPDAVRTRTEELAPTRVVVLGGTGVVGPGVLAALDGLRSPLRPIELQPVVAGGETDVTVAPAG